jgi:uncharacterized membrane protein (UPF0127 family)
VSGAARLVTLLFALFAGLPSPAAGTLPVRFERSDGVFVPYALEIASTDAERTRGLMHRRFLAATGGMLFDFGREQQVAMWMRDTFVSLDMLFVDGSGVVVDVLRDAVPLSEALLAPRAPARYVVELAAGQAALRGLARGDRLHLPAAAVTISP